MRIWLVASLTVASGWDIFELDVFVNPPRIACEEFFELLMSESEVASLVRTATSSPHCFDQVPLDFRFVVAQLLANRHGSSHEWVHGLWRKIMTGRFVEDGVSEGVWMQAMKERVEGEMKEFRSILLDLRQGGSMSLSEGAVGAFSTIEALRRETFGLWVLDGSLVRGMTRWFLQTHSRRFEAPLISVGDFGAGGGHYAQSLNATGLVLAHAFDGTPNIAAITQGRVQFLDLTNSIPPMLFDWVISLEVAEHIPPGSLPMYLRNLEKSCRLGLVISWAENELGIGHLSHMPLLESRALILRETQLSYDPQGSEYLRSQSEVEYIKRTVSVFLK